MKHKVIELRPTQFALGLFEVESKIEKLEKLVKDELEPFLEAHPVPGVLYKHDEIFLIDHHHLVRACWELGIEKVIVKIEADLSHLEESQFWDEMTKRGWNHLYDQFGHGPHDPALLPANVRGMADDFYRSLSWALREEGGYLKTATLFGEFKWANFLRARLKKQTATKAEKALERLLGEALELAKSEEAKHLPGFIDLDSKKASRDNK
jgi:hypothetical protein